MDVEKTGQNKKFSRKEAARREVDVRIRLTPEEKDWLMEKAKEGPEAKTRDGQPVLSAYIRQILLSESGYRSEEAARMLIRLRYDVNKISVNINQVVKKINSGFGTASDIRILKENQADIENAFRNLEKEVSGLWQSQS